MRKKILMIGTLNDILRDLLESLQKSYVVQFCDTNEEMIRKSYSVYKDTDAFVVNLGDLTNKDMMHIVSVIGYKWMRILPVVIIGTSGECNSFRKLLSEYVKKNQKNVSYIYARYKKQLEEIHFMERPLTNPEIVKKVEQLCPPLGEEQKADELAGSDEVSEAHRIDNGKRTLVVIDDDSMILRHLKKTLGETYNVYVSTSGATGIGVIEKQSPDAILLDYEMPGFDGTQVLEMIRMNENMKHIPVFFLTGVADASKVSEAVSMKPQGYILKSNIGDVIHVIDRYFENIAR